MLKSWMTEDARAVVIIVHGAGEHHGCYTWMIERLNRLGFHVITGDLPGYGKTRGKRGHIDHFHQYIDTLYTWCREAMALEVPVFLFGHSMGGLITIRTLMEKYLTVQGVILSSPCLGLYEYPGRFMDMTAKVIHRLAPSLKVESGLKAERVTRDDDSRASYQEDELIISTVTMRWYQEMVKAMKTSLLYSQRYPDIPTLVLQAGEDYVVDSSAVHRWFNRLEISDRSLKEWKGLYHELLNEPEREDVFQFMMNFMYQRL